MNKIDEMMSDAAFGPPGDARTVNPGQPVGYHNDGSKLSGPQLDAALKHDAAMREAAKKDRDPVDIDKSAIAAGGERADKLRREIEPTTTPFQRPVEQLARIMEYANLRCQVAIAATLDEIAAELGVTPNWLVKLPEALANARAAAAPTPVAKPGPVRAGAPSDARRLDDLEARVRVIEIKTGIA